MLNKPSSVRVKDFKYIGQAITEGEGLYANQIMNARDRMEREYGSSISNVKLAVAKFSKNDVLGAYGNGVVYMAEKYAKNKNMTSAMQYAEQTGFHPKTGGKSGAEVTVAHELGHYLGERASVKAGISQRDIVARASKTIGVKTNKMASKISEYARTNYNETIAEAFADVYANGKRASKASTAIINEIKKIL